MYMTVLITQCQVYAHIWYILLVETYKTTHVGMNFLACYANSELIISPLHVLGT